MILWGTSAQATCLSTITVTNNADSGAGSLRQAITDVCSGGTITFDNDYTITLASELKIVNKTITITGAGHHITISGNNAVRVFHVGDYDTAGSGNLTLDQLNIVNGKSTFNGVDLCDGQEAGCGGGLLLDYLTVATVLNCTFSNNDGGIQGGAIYSYYGNPLIVTNSTFTSNHALAYAGAIQFFYGSATLTNNTFTGNAATNPGGYGGAVLNNWGTVTFRNNIFASNAASNGGNCDNSGGTFNDGGGNLVWGDTTDCPGVSANPLLGTLGYYGGDVPNLPLLPGSPAINAASANCPGTDARGITRGATCDSGAFESQGFTLTKTGGDSQSADITTAFADPLALSVTSAYGEPVDGGKVTFTPPASGASAAITGSPVTISGGSASVTATANGTVGGPYNVTATAAGAASVAFSLTNVALSTTTTVAVSSTTTTAVSSTTTVAPVSSTTTIVMSSTTTVAAGSSTSTIAAGSTTTTTTAVCSVRISPGTIGWFMGNKEKNRFLWVVGPEGAAYDKNTAIAWSTDAIETLRTWVFFKRLLLMKVRISGAGLVKGDYTLTVDSCTGTVHLVR